MLDEISKVDSQEGLRFITALLLNELMKKEREIRLRDSIDNKANGYYERKLACFLGSLDLSVPRHRKGEFRPSILPDRWEKADDSFQEFVLNLVLHSYSPGKIPAGKEGEHIEGVVVCKFYRINLKDETQQKDG